MLSDQDVTYRPHSLIHILHSPRGTCVPQGSVLKPILFVLYTADFISVIEFTVFIHIGLSTDLRQKVK